MSNNGPQDRPNERVPEHKTGDMNGPEARPLSRAFRSLYFSLFLIFIIVAIASFMPNSRLWGINHLAFYSVKTRILALLLMACSFIPPVFLTIYGLLSRIMKPITEGKTVRVLSLSVIILALLYLLHARTQIMNENEFLSLVLQKADDAAEVTPVSISEILTKEHAAPGTLIVYILASGIANPPSRGFVIGAMFLSIALGWIFFLRLLRFIGQMKIKAPISVLLLFLLLFSGVSELFTGYMSKYLFLYAFGGFYVLSSFRFLRGKGTIIGPAVFFALSILLHTLGVLLAPSFAFLVLTQYPRKTGNRFIRPSWLSLIFLTLLAALAGAFMEKLKGLYLPPTGSAQTDGIFTPGHIIDVINVFLMVLPAIPLLISLPAVNAKLAGAVGLSAAGLMKDDADNAPSPSDKHTDIEGKFAFLLFFSWTIFLLLFNPSTSVARGWDRFALAGLGIFPMMVIGLKRFVFYIDLVKSKLKRAMEESKEKKTPDKASMLGRQLDELERIAHRGYASFVTPAVVISIVMSLSWIGINMSEKKSAERIDKILAFDKKSAAEGYLHLSFYYSLKDKTSRAIQYAEKAIALKPEGDSYMSLALLYVSAGDSASAIDRLYECTEKLPDYYQARHSVITLLDAQKRFEEIIKICKKGIELEPKEPQYYYFMGKAYLYTGKVPQGVRALLKCRDLNPSKDTMYRIEELFKRIRRPKP